jgi:SAM-dependent MidA family methyltransferase
MRVRVARAWLDALPESIDGVVVANEVLDAMPVELIHFDGLARARRAKRRGRVVRVEQPATTRGRR